MDIYDIYGHGSKLSTAKIDGLITGWWFGTWILFFHSVGNNSPNWRPHIFQRGWNHQPDIHIYIYTSSTAQGGGGSFKNRKHIGEIGCCEPGMAERIQWWTERCLRSPLFLSLSLTIYLPTSLSSMYLCIYLSIYLSLSLSLICLSV